MAKVVLRKVTKARHAAERKKAMEDYKNGGHSPISDMTKIYILGALFILMVLFGGCAGSTYHTKEIVHERHTIYHLYEGGECVDVGGGLWVENEGNKIDIYSNSTCSHVPDEVKCNNVYSQESCFIGNRVFFIEGMYNYMELHVLTY